MTRTVIDSRGSFCPGPLTDLFKAFRKAAPGDELELWATDPAAKSDVSAWAAKGGHAVTEVSDEADHIKIVVQLKGV